MARSYDLPDGIMDAASAAEMIGISPAKLRYLGKQGEGPACARAGGRTVYFAKDVEEYVSELRRAERGCSQ